MKTVVDILIVVFLGLGVFAGFKKGLIKSLVGFIGLVAVLIISFALKTPLANFLIDHMPFINIGGGLTSLNVLVYNAIAFIVVFVLLYCVLNVILMITKFIDTLLKFTVIWILPSKIGGAIVGFLEAWVYLYVVLFVLIQFSFTAGFIKDSNIAHIILDKTPIVGKYFGGVSKAGQEISDLIDDYNKSSDKDLQDLNLRILQIEINHGLVKKDKAQELMEIGKIDLKNVLFGKEVLKWLNI